MGLSDGISDGIIGGAAALLAAAFGAFMARRDTSAAFKAASQLQNEKIDQEYALSWDERGLSRLQDAYVPLYEYVRRYQVIIATQLAISGRRQNSLLGIPDRLNVEKRNAEIVEKERSLFEAEGPTEAEQGLLDTIPSAKDDFHLQALVEVFGSQEIQDEFVRFRNTKDDIVRILARNEAALLGLPAPLGNDPDIHDVSAASVQVLEVAQESIGLAKLPDLTERFFATAKKLSQLTVQELDRDRSEIVLDRRRESTEATAAQIAQSASSGPTQSS